MADLKLVYAAPTEETALNELELFREKWDPSILKSTNSGMIIGQLRRLISSILDVPVREDIYEYIVNS